MNLRVMQILEPTGMSIRESFHTIINFAFLLTSFKTNPNSAMCHRSVIYPYDHQLMQLVSLRDLNLGNGKLATLII